MFYGHFVAAFTPVQTKPDRKARPPTKKHKKKAQSGQTALAEHFPATLSGGR